jgi:hypothetical protein
MFEESLFLQRLLSGGSGWIQPTLLAGMLLVLVLRPEKLRHRTLFLLAAISLALSIIAPPVLLLLVSGLGTGTFGGPWGRAGNPVLPIATNVAGPFFQAASILLAVLSLMPSPTSPFDPPKHPLE